MINIKYLIPVFAILLLVIAWYAFFDKNEKPEHFVTRTIKLKPDTVISYINVSKTGKGKTFKEESISDKIGRLVYNKIDSDSVTNFSADLKYYPDSGIWDNRYSIPYKRIIEKEIIQTNTAATKEGLLWQIGIGAKCFYLNNNFSIAPSLSVGAVFPYKSLELSIDIKIEPLLNQKDLLLNPSINTLLKIRF